MPVRKADAVWNGTLKEGAGVMKLQSGAYEGPFTFASRFEEGKGTNPEELIGAAHAGCFSMFLSAILTADGFPPTRIDTTAHVHLEAGPTIAKIVLVSAAAVPNIDDLVFQEYVQKAKAGCPVSKALAAVPSIEVQAKLV